MISESPLVNRFMPRVAMKGGSLSLATITPEIPPQVTPVRMATARPTQMGRCQFTTAWADITAVSVIIVPIDKSMPPVMMMKLTPTASTPFTAVASMMAIRLAGWKKFGDASENPTIRMTRLEKARIFCFACDDLKASFAAPSVFTVAAVAIVIPSRFVSRPL